jgi:hypothetical protein
MAAFRKETAMPAARRLLAAFLLLIGAFLVLVGFAVASLYTVGQPVLAAVVATAGVAGVAAGSITYWLLRRDGIGDDPEPETELLPEPEPPMVKPRAHAAPAARMSRTPLRVQTMPVAKLPPAYVDAVMRGAQARLNALKAQPGSVERR